MKTEIKETNHTPTPWHAGTTQLIDAAVYDANENCVCIIVNPNKADLKTAVFIARAVNSHEALLEVQQRAEELADVVRNGGNYHRAVEWFDEANQEYIALCKAEGK